MTKKKSEKGKGSILASTFRNVAKDEKQKLVACRETWRWSYIIFFQVYFWPTAVWLQFLFYGCDWVPLVESSRVLSFAEPLRWRTPLPPMPPPSARSPHSHLSPPPSDRLEFWRVGVPWGRPFFSSGKGSGERESEATYIIHVTASTGLKSVIYGPDLQLEPVNATAFWDHEFEVKTTASWNQHEIINKCIIAFCCTLTTKEHTFVSEYWTKNIIL